MIGPRVAKPSKADDADAYELATLRDADTCQRCRRNCGPSARDHRQNRRRGNTVPSNLQVLGLRCHQWKTEHPDDALEQGWAVPSWGVPAEWPARRWLPTEYGTVRLAWVLYTDAGGVDEITEADAMERMKGAGW
jgi:hypothetical protein